jgi:uncharacterized protein with HEPN domain
MARAIQDRLRDIIEALDDVAAFSASLDQPDFLALPVKDRKTFMALRGAFIQLGEAMKALPAELTHRHSHIRWSGIAGMRDIIVHHYHRIEVEVFWDVISSGELADLRAAVAAELR